MPDDENDDSTEFGRETTAYGTTPDHDEAQEPDGARGSGTGHGLGQKIKQGLNSVTGRDLDTASPAENERSAEAGGGGTDGR